MLGCYKGDMTEPGLGHESCVLPSDYALILVGILPSKRDLEFARVLGWYRIPYRFAPKLVRVDYLAFYQPASFGDGLGARIEIFTEFRGVELTTRREIIRNEPDHPRANEEYYKIQIGALNKLQNPIQAKKWRRITFFYTTGKLFAVAKSVNDLIIRSDERDMLWHSLRERSISLINTSPGDNRIPPDMTMDMMKLIGQVYLSDGEQDWD